MHLEGAKVGILDGDIYGPSIPALLGLMGSLSLLTVKQLFQWLGMEYRQIVSVVNPKDEAMVWRGPMVTQALEQLLRQTAWNNLDYLFIDLPPGTGDIHLTLAQKVPLTGAIIVTTHRKLLFWMP